MIRLSPQLRAALQRFTLPVLVLLSVAIVIVGKADQMMLDSLRMAVSDKAAPVLDLLSRPLATVGDAAGRVRAFFSVYQDNARLEQDNERLLHWQAAALKLSSENNQLRGLLKLVPDTAVSFVSARVVANSGGAYVRSVMINAGLEQGAARGDAAITGEGLVGRITELGDRSARVLLITDLNSRVPVVVERTRTNAILAGDNSERPRLLYLPQDMPVQVGDRIVTAGQGGVFPPGLPVGVVASIDEGGPRIAPYVELSEVGYLRIVNYGLAGSLPQPVPVAHHPVRHGKTAAKAGDPTEPR